MGSMLGSSRPASLAALALVAALGSGCAARSAYMQPLAGAHELAAPQGKALLVIMRPSGLGSAVRFTVTDGDGRFLGQALAGSYYAVEMDPGEHRLYAWSESVTAMHATLEAGRVYYVLVEPRMGAFVARVALTPFTSRHRDWGRRAEWLSRSRALRVDFAAGQAHFDANREWLLGKIERGRQAWEDLSATRRAELTLGPADGVG